jgi:hypothetical protein
MKAMAKLEREPGVHVFSTIFFQTKVQLCANAGFFCQQKETPMNRLKILYIL